jgi:hypothetical protein
VLSLFLFNNIVNFCLFRLGKTVYNIRLKTTPPFPRDITFDIPPQFRTTSSDNNFLLYDHLYARKTKRILIFSSEFLMRKMCSSNVLSMDGTFSVVPKMFKQLYIIIAIDEVTHSGEFLFVILQNYLSLYSYKCV